MYRLIYLLTLVCLISSGIALNAQSTTIEGYVYETNNRGYLNLVKITVTEKSTNSIVNRAVTDKDGFFSVQVPDGKDYTILAEKDVFQTKSTDISTRNSGGKKMYTKIEMSREAGYLFDVTLAEKWDGKSQVDAIQGAKIEIFNNTKEEEVLVLTEHPDPYFKHTFEKGNHYTVMIRKKGYFTKRMEAYVDIDGCILCFDGLDEVSPGAPGASDNLTSRNTMGTIVANVELIPIVINEGIKIKNIYYDLAKWDIRPDAASELDKLLITLKSNPALIVELGSHTDSRGKDPYNLELSQKRAKAAVQYLTEVGGIDPTRMYAKGYGETQLENKCKNGIKCRESEHQENRRTELKIIGIRDVDPFDGKSLAQIINEENFDKMLEDVQNQDVVEIKEGQDLPAEIRRQMEGGKADIASSGAASIPTKEPVYQAPPPAPEPSYTPPPARTETTYTPPPAPAKTQPTYTPPPAPTKTQPTYTPPPPPQAKEEVVYTKPPPPPSSTGAASTTIFTEDFNFVDESEILPTRSRNKSTQNISRPPNQIPNEYSGYKIEFYNSRSELPLSHEIFSRHGNISIEQKKNGAYAYLLGDFINKASASNFLRDIIAQRYPGSMVVKYSNGRRVSN